MLITPKSVAKDIIAIIERDELFTLTADLNNIHPKSLAHSHLRSHPVPDTTFIHR